MSDSTISRPRRPSEDEPVLTRLRIEYTELTPAFNTEKLVKQLAGASDEITNVEYVEKTSDAVSLIVQGSPTEINSDDIEPVINDVIGEHNYSSLWIRRVFQDELEEVQNSNRSLE